MRKPNILLDSKTYSRVSSVIGVGHQGVRDFLESHIEFGFSEKTWRTIKNTGTRDSIRSMIFHDVYRLWNFYMHLKKAIQDKR